MEMVLDKLSSVPVLCICEHWFIHEELHVPIIYDFKIAGLFCTTVKNHGGVAIYVKSKLNATLLIQVNEISCECDYEIVGITLKHIFVIIVSIYGAPNNNCHKFLDKFEQSINLCCNKAN